MNNSVSYSPEFKNNLKPLAKKYFTLKQSIKSLEEDLIINPYLGESYGEKIYKVRLRDESKGKGKRGGFRLMYYLLSETGQGIEILMLTIFDKSEVSTIKKKTAVSLKNYILEKIGRKNK